jgi:hypothetical protein
MSRPSSETSSPFPASAVCTIAIPVTRPEAPAPLPAAAESPAELRPRPPTERPFRSRSPKPRRDGNLHGGDCWLHSHINPGRRLISATDGLLANHKARRSIDELRSRIDFARVELGPGRFPSDHPSFSRLHPWGNDRGQRRYNAWRKSRSRHLMTARIVRQLRDRPTRPAPAGLDAVSC